MARVTTTEVHRKSPEFSTQNSILVSPGFLFHYSFPTRFIHLSSSHFFLTYLLPLFLYFNTSRCHSKHVALRTKCVAVFCSCLFRLRVCGRAAECLNTRPTCYTVCSHRRKCTHTHSVHIGVFCVLTQSVV
jgi:hypothetical protein